MKRFICAQSCCPVDKHKCTFTEDECPAYIRSIETVNEPTNKYQAQKCEFNGEKFDSRKELAHYLELRLLERSGEITDLRRQVKFELIPAQKDEKGKCLERAVTYIADFVYKDKQGITVVEDVKGYKEGGAYSVFTIKRKLMLYFHGIRIKEI